MLSLRSPSFLVRVCVVFSITYSATAPSCVRFLRWGPDLPPGMDIPSHSLFLRTGKGQQEPVARNWQNLTPFKPGRTRDDCILNALLRPPQTTPPTSLLLAFRCLPYSSLSRSPCKMILLATSYYCKTNNHVASVTCSNRYAFVSHSLVCSLAGEALSQMEGLPVT